MWKKIIIFTAVLLLSVASIGIDSMEVFAEELGAEVDSSYLLTENALIGYMDKQTKGVYLASGYSAIQDNGGGKIAAGGGTNATTMCKVALNVIVERLDGASWKRVTSWTATADYDMVVMSSRVISVGRGYYYRVRCIHYAASDVSSSSTSALLM